MVLAGCQNENSPTERFIFVARDSEEMPAFSHSNYLNSMQLHIHVGIEYVKFDFFILNGYSNFKLPDSERRNFVRIKCVLFPPVRAVGFLEFEMSLRFTSESVCRRDHKFWRESAARSHTTAHNNENKYELEIMVNTPSVPRKS